METKVKDYLDEIKTLYDDIETGLEKRDGWEKFVDLKQLEIETARLRDIFLNTNSVVNRSPLKVEVKEKQQSDEDSSSGNS